jgi:D-alanyl-lipoteichoic acid acyltransferase DltB (MBOAT superfamily)
MQNFNLPYFATNPSDFWRRWHISLSTWLRDYLYIPLGGNRKGTRRTYFNLMATMVLGGLWHGAAWTFVLWGVFHGGMLCVHRAIQPWLERFLNPKGRLLAGLWFWIRAAVFFQLVCFGWLLFRADSVRQVGEMLGAAVTRWTNTPGSFGLVVNDVLIVGACLLLFAGVQFAQWFKRDLEFPLRLPVPVRALVYAAGMLGFILFGNYNAQPFIYFQF